MPSVPSSQDGTLGTVGDEMLGIPVHAIPPPVVHQGPIRLLDRKVSSATRRMVLRKDLFPELR